MKAFFSLICLLCFALSSFAQLDITFTDVDSREDKLVVSIYDSESSFKSRDAFVRATVAANSGALKYRNDDLKPGYYVVTVFHDLNNNAKFDKNFLGMPKEPYGVSRNAKEQYGPPKYENARFYYDGSALSLSIKVD